MLFDLRDPGRQPIKILPKSASENFRKRNTLKCISPTAETKGLLVTFSNLKKFKKMGSEVLEKVKKKKNKKSKRSNVISFDEEVVPKHVAQELLKIEEENINTAEEKKSKKHKRKKKNLDNEEGSSENPGITNIEDINFSGLEEKKRKKKKKKGVDSDETETNKAEEPDKLDHDTVESAKKKKKKKIIENQEPDEAKNVEDDSVEPKKKKRKKLVAEEEENEESKSPESKKESIRARKRKKYAQLLEEKKMKAEVAFQEKALNYLSKWKHSRDEWKFEKLRQIWLQHNMYDSVKVPQEFWETLIEYFSNSKGKARDVLLKEALKIIEEENEENKATCKMLRARDIIQNLQE